MTFDYEPSIVDSDKEDSGHLSITLPLDGVRWKADSERVVAQLVYAVGSASEPHEQSTSGELSWRRLPGCRYIDLMATDRDLVVRAAVRVRRPAGLAAEEVEFAIDAAAAQLAIIPVGPGAPAFRVVLLERRADRSWYVSDQGALGRQGRAFSIPRSYQGAFAIEDPNHRLVAIQPFAHQQTAPATDALRAELRDIYPMDKPDSWLDDWPEWLQKKFLRPLSKFIEFSQDAHVLEAQLRTAARRGLLRKCLPLTTNYRTELRIEEFATSVWPRTEALWKLDLSESHLNQAFEQRDSPDLTEALAWANGDGARLIPCLRAVPVRRLHRRLAPLVPKETLTGDALSALGELLSHSVLDTDRIDAKVSDVRDQGLAEFGVALAKEDNLSHDHFAWAESLVALNVAIQPTQPRGISTSESLRMLLEGLTEAVASPLAELVEQAIATNLVASEPLKREIELARATVAREVDRLLANAQARQATVALAPLGQLLTLLLRHKDSLPRTIACQQLASSIRRSAVTRLQQLAPSLEGGAQPLPEGAPLTDFLRQNLAAATKLGEIERDRRERDARRARITAALPEGVDPDAPDATAFIDGGITKLLAKLDRLIEAAAVLPLEAEDVASLETARRELQVPGHQASLGLDERAVGLTKWQGVVEAIESRSIMHLCAAGASEPVVRLWLERDGVAQARLASDIELEGRRILWSQVPPLAELLWLSDDEYLREHGPRVARDVTRLGQIDKAALHRLKDELATMRARIAANDGVAALKSALSTVRRRRWREFASELTDGQYGLAEASLPSILVATGALSYGVDGPAIGAAPYPRPLPEEIRGRLARVGLWPHVKGESL